MAYQAVGGWMENCLIYGFVTISLLMLHLDGYSSYYIPNVIDKAAEESVILFCLLPHSKTKIVLLC